MEQEFGRKDILHYPQLDTILMVEEFIRNLDRNMNKKQIWVRLPKKTMYQTFCVVLDYLEKSNKITYDIKGNVVWIFNSGINKKLQDIIARSVAV